MNYNIMWPGGPTFVHDEASFRPGTDSILLAWFAAGGPVKRACDLGCGTGVISLIMAWQDDALTVDGVEIQPEWTALARENLKLCSLDDRVTIIDGDLRRHREFLEAGAYDLVVANPPYYALGSGKSAPEESRAKAREERESTLADIAAAAAYLTRWGGRFALVHKPERLAEVIRTLSEKGLEPKRLRFVQYRHDSAPNLVLIESRRGGNPSLTVEPPLILTDSAGNDTEEVKRIYHRE
ncbi:tRNA1Val (adenine37-N6)-methyltransferase [Sporobacter termitidis DSM 10068]|uniref:tRNA1Val (Adenine37-N6)-methyltransferase n=1 Tax=Sporobacter termitidis DSM 10068 TaxID=1123282 RepID=A0A1M5YVQ6_9FIRM|nr:methyltransferase [Sporobacter termitidis]SHI15934.1 tRNA1Val (adenine37-N6)-methyltransferase [Sporobacter termitidis DSM 10068]